MPPDDPAKLADTLEALAINPQRAKEQGRKSRELAIAKYTWKRAVADTFTELAKLRNGHIG